MNAPHEDSKSQSSDSDDFHTEIILTLMEEIRSIQGQNDKLSKMIHQQNCKENDWAQKENNYIIEIKRYQDQIQVLSEKMRSLDAEKKGTSPSETSESDEYKIGLDSGHLEPILDDQSSQEIQDVVIDNVDFHEALKTENKHLKRVIIELKSKCHGKVAKNDMSSLTLQQKYDDIKDKYNTFIGLTPFPSKLEWANSSHIIIEDVMNAYINKDHEFRLVERVNGDLRRKIAAYDGLLAENQKQREKMVHLTERWHRYKQKVRVWKQQMHQQCVQPFQNLQANAHALSELNKIQAQQIFTLYNHTSELERMIRSLVWDHAKMVKNDQNDK